MASQLPFKGDAPPGTWRPAHRLAQRALAPVERFLHVEASSGLVLFLAAALALIWANSPWRDGYARVWHAVLGVELGPLVFRRDMHFWINEGLMTIFFFVVGLEIRREVHRGELSELKRAALPVVAALGGMVVPAGIYLAFNSGHASSAGWGVPMATDIAFAVGALALLGSRVAPALRVLLLALAVIDDVGAIVVIAAFYSSGFSVAGIAVLGGGLLLALLFQKLGVRSPWAYLLPAATTWVGAYQAGIHPTLAGVALGLMTPATAWLGPDRFAHNALQSVARVQEKQGDDEHAIVPHLDALNEARREAISPLERIQHALHSWVAFGIMPLFAFANAGVELGAISFNGDAVPVLLGVIGGLVVGKPLGILGASWLAARARIVALPTGVTWPQVGVVGMVGGIGFTMALFIAELAFEDAALLCVAKVGILVASGVAAVAGVLAGRVVMPAELPTGAATSLEDAECRTDA